MGEFIMILGVLTCIVGGIWFLVVAFGEGILWGLATMFVPLVSLIFLILYWHKAKRPFFVQLFALGLMILGAFLSHR